MKIGRLLTWHWGSLEDREWVFADTVLLTGESGSGKSTLLDAIQTLLTAAHQHLVQFNIGQDESTQSRRGGKEPRTLAAYALGQQADGDLEKALKDPSRKKDKGNRMSVWKGGEELDSFQFQDVVCQADFDV